jgi:hypothetical protein
MVMRFLLGLIGSLLSGSVVAVLFTALVQYAFPDSTEYQPAPIGTLAAHEDSRSKRVPPEPGTRPPIRSATVSDSGSEAAAALKPASEPASPRDTTTIPPTLGQSLEQSDRESRALTQAAAQNRGQLLSASMAADPLTDDVHQKPEAPKTTPLLPAQQSTLAGVLQPISAASSPEPDATPRPITDQKSDNHKRDIAKMTVAGDAHPGAVTSTRAPRGRQITRASHHAHRRSGHAEDHRAPIRQAQRQAQE